MEKTIAIGSAVLMAVIVFALTGCGGTRGWQVSFGVHPVSAVQEGKQLDPKHRAAK